MRISIPDDLYDRIKAVHRDPTGAIVRVAETLPLMEKGRTITLGPDQVAELEALLAGGSLTSGADLCRKVHRLAEVKVGEITLRLDTTDFERMAQRAARINKPLNVYLQLMLDRFKEEWLMIGERVELTGV